MSLGKMIRNANCADSQGLRGEESTYKAMQAVWILPTPGSGRSPGEGSGNPLVFLPGKSHGQRSLVAYNSWGPKRVRHDLANKRC